jgi:hypothetical protein
LLLAHLLYQLFAGATKRRDDSPTTKEKVDIGILDDMTFKAIYEWKLEKALEGSLSTPSSKKGSSPYAELLVEQHHLAVS